MGLEENSLGRIVHRFYEAAAQPDLWRTVLHETSIALGAEGAVLIAHPRPDQGIVFSEGLGELVDTFVRGGWENARAARTISRDPWQLYHEANTFTPDEVKRSPFYQELLQPLGFGWCAGTTLAKSGETSIVMSIERQLRRDPFTNRELATIQALLPHLRRAAEIAIRLGLQRSEGMLDAFSAIDCGGMLLDGLGRVMRMNALAERHIGGGIDVVNRQLITPDRGARAGLHRLLGAVLNPRVQETKPEGALVIQRPRRRPLIVHAAPVVGSSRDVFQSAKALLLFVDLEDHREPAEPILRQAFGLTPAEARVALHVTRGGDLAAYASAHQVSLGTARTQLKSVLSKVGAHRQAELVAIVSRIGVPLATGRAG